MENETHLNPLALEQRVEKKVRTLWKESVPEDFIVGKRIEFSYSDIIDGSVSLVIDEFRVKDSISV
jgi:hypothetical protein